MKEGNVPENHIVEFTLKGSTRRELRDSAVKQFLSEKGGYWEGGKKHVTLYRYNVEKLKDGKKIFLLKPTFLNKGIDFQVWVEGLKSDKDARPSHKDIFEDLRIKKSENQEDFLKLMKLVDRVWNCEDPNDIIKGTTLHFKKGYSVELLLKILKWLFIEQDITYWNYDGRGMLKSAIDDIAKS
jgi:hypothetical protein